MGIFGCDFRVAQALGIAGTRVAPSSPASWRDRASHRTLHTGPVRSARPTRRPYAKQGVGAIVCDVSYPFRITHGLTAVLAAMLSDPVERYYGLELSTATGIRAGSIYPVLTRLERHGWARSSWEEVDPASVGRPRRRYYQLTGTGELAARELLSERAMQRRAIPWDSSLIPGFQS